MVTVAQVVYSKAHDIVGIWFLTTVGDNLQIEFTDMDETEFNENLHQLHYPYLYHNCFM
jgi:hypothetical protein